MEKGTQQMHVVQRNTTSVEVKQTEAAHSRVVGQVMETNQYGLFRFITGNREIKTNHALDSSIRMYGILQPIKVDKDFNIIEGQHRYTYAKKNSKPIRYIVTEDQGPYQMGEISELNSTSRKWSVNDYIHSFVAQGNPEYIKLKQLLEDIKDIGAPIFTLATVALGYRLRTRKTDVRIISNGEFKFYNYDGLLLFIDEYRKFLRRTGVEKGRDMFSAFFYLYTLENFESERLINKVNSTNKAERLIGIKGPMVIVEHLIDAYNNRLGTDSPNFINYTISVEPKTKGQIMITGEVSNELVRPTV